MTFAKPYDPLTVKPTSPGLEIRQDFVKRLDEHGNPYLIEAGQTNIQEYIQSFADETDINYILNRYVNGDQTVLARRQGFYADISGAPRDLAEAYAIVDKARGIYDRLPVEAIEHVGSFEGFLDSFSTRDKFLKFNSFMNNLNKKDVDGELRSDSTLHKNQINSLKKEGE